MSKNKLIGIVVGVVVIVGVIMGGVRIVYTMNKNNNESALESCKEIKANAANNMTQTQINNLSTQSTNGIQIANNNYTQRTVPGSIIVENTTQKPIPSDKLIAIIKTWILNGQYNCTGYAPSNGTTWVSEWLDNIPDANFVQYFIKANGKAALSENITAGELNKTASASLIFAAEHPVPFTKDEILGVVKEAFQRYYPKQDVTKVTFNGNQTEAGLYSVYTQAGGDTTPFAYMQSNMGTITQV